MSERRRVVITGLGVLSPAGTTPEAVWTWRRGVSASIRRPSCRATRSGIEIPLAPVSMRKGASTRSFNSTCTSIRVPFRVNGMRSSRPGVSPPERKAGTIAASAASGAGSVS